LWLVNCC